MYYDGKVSDCKMVKFQMVSFEKFLAPEFFGA